MSCVVCNNKLGLISYAKAFLETISMILIWARFVLVFIVTLSHWPGTIFPPQWILSTSSLLSPDKKFKIPPSYCKELIVPNPKNHNPMHQGRQGHWWSRKTPKLEWEAECVWNSLRHLKSDTRTWNLYSASKTYLHLQEHLLLFLVAPEEAVGSGKVQDHRHTSEILLHFAWLV